MFAIRILLLLAIGLLLFNCTRRKKAPGNISDWLELHFPGRFVVLDTRISDPIKNLSFKVKKSVIAEKSDSLLQIFVTWDKRDPELGLSVTEIEQQFDRARSTLADARQLLALIKQAKLTNVSVSIWNGDAQVLVFKEPTPAQRKQVLLAMKPVLQSWDKSGQYKCRLIFMEPSTLGVEFGEIVPVTHWTRPDSWQARQSLVNLEIKPDVDFDVNQLNQQWLFNTDADRLLVWLDKSRPIAEQWASGHLKMPVYFNNQSEHMELAEHLGARLRFPFSYEENGGIAGYIQGDYLLDSDRFENLKVSD